MPRPPDVPDPRDPDAPWRNEDPVMDGARSRVTIGELLAGQPPSRVGDELPAEPIDWDQIIADIGPERWAELKQRFFEILAALRERRGYVEEG